MPSNVPAEIAWADEARPIWAIVRRIQRQGARLMPGYFIAGLAPAGASSPSGIGAAGADASPDFSGMDFGTAVDQFLNDMRTSFRCHKTNLRK